MAVEKQYQPADIETVYFDPETIRQDGTRATVWQLTEINRNGTSRYLSTKTHKEFGCEGFRVRVLQAIEFFPQMGTGRSTTGYIEHGNWQPVEARGINTAL